MTVQSICAHGIETVITDPLEGVARVETAVCLDVRHKRVSPAPVKVQP